MESRSIAEEDYPLIERLMGVSSNDVVNMFHNFFTSYREKSVQRLEWEAANAHSEEKRVVYETFLELARKYDHYTCHHLARELEKF